MSKIRCVHCNQIKNLQNKFEVNSFKIYFCNSCQNGFIYPIPKNLSKYYSDQYWIPPGIIGIIRVNLYKLFQLRRKLIVKKYLKEGKILDVGAGEGVFASTLTNSHFKVTSIDAPKAHIKNKDVIKVDFLKWETKEKYDGIVFWESLEHVPYPRRYLEKASKILKKNGFLFIESPNFGSLESRYFQQNWYHLDPPRHLSHFTKKGMQNLFKSTGFKELSSLDALAFEYTIWGFIASFLRVRSEDSYKVFKNKTIILFVLPLAFLAVIFQFISWGTGQSPIVLSVAKKED